MASIATSTSNRRKVIVIGAGIIGLSSAVVIAENVRHVDVQVVAERFTSDTTSSGAGGLWAPEVAHGLINGAPENELKLREFATKTYNHAHGLARSPDAGQVGVFCIPYYKVFYYPQNQGSHWWKNVVPDYRRISKEEINTNFPGVSDGYTFTSLVTDCTHYLPYLQDRLLRAGGRISKQKISSLHVLAGQCDVVVNCSGLGAQELISDKNMTPCRAQVIQVEAPWIHYALEVEPALKTSKYRFYFIPRCNEVILGGTQYHAPDMSVNLQDREAIMNETAHFMPSLKKAKFIRDWVGLRPNRTIGLRMEKEIVASGSKKLHVVHNYGHSGQGITLHWGCALEAAKMVQDTLNETTNRMTTSKL